MISAKKQIQQLVAILQAREIFDIVISPGSRSGPLVHTLAENSLFRCRNIVDERSAGYFAIGLSQSVGKPVVLVCSSGTAALNYAPAVAEAFYRNIPLIVLTAARPAHWINQGENQTLNQNSIYAGFVRHEITIPMGESERELWFAGREISNNLNMATAGNGGPVHINIPLEEPLHDVVDEPLPSVKDIARAETATVISENELTRLVGIYNSSEKVLILAGQQSPNPHLENILDHFVRKTGAAVLHEHLANLHNDDFCGTADLLLSSIISSEHRARFHPDLVISFGGMFVSGAIKRFLRENRAQNHWHIDIEDEVEDTYTMLTRTVGVDAGTFFSQMLPHVEPKRNIYASLWKEQEETVKRLRNGYISKIAFCDLAVFASLQKYIPKHSAVHLGNSSPVRYALLFDPLQGVEYYGNRGVSGIDGSVSTAVGFASQSKKINTIVVGDLSFFYDSNALWNRYPGDNLRIIVVHNGGGNIFSMIDIPDRSPAFREHFFAENSASARGIAQTFGLDYLSASNFDEFEAALGNLYSPARNEATILEVFTDAEVNAQVYREVYSIMK